ncbi:hypothetical protein INR49_022491, partial [Caranx melampygus]
SSGSDGTGPSRPSSLLLLLLLFIVIVLLLFLPGVLLPPQCLSEADGSRTAQYSFSKAVLVSQPEAAECYRTVNRSAASWPHSRRLRPRWCPVILFTPDFCFSPVNRLRVKKVSVVNMKASHYVPIHSKQIRGLSFNRQNDSLLLSAALDNTIKLTSLLTNTVVQTYNAGNQCGAAAGVWTTATTCTPPEHGSCSSTTPETPARTSRSCSRFAPGSCGVSVLRPAGSVQLVPLRGISRGLWGAVFFWEQSQTIYSHTSCRWRPAASTSRWRLGPAAQLLLLSGADFNAGSSCKLLTKNAVFRRPTEEGRWCGTLAAALCSRNPLPTSHVGHHPFSVNGDHFLASLTEKMLKLYRWE